MVNHKKNEQGDISIFALIITALSAVFCLSLISQGTLRVQGEICSVESRQTQLREAETAHILNEIATKNQNVMGGLILINQSYNWLAELRFLIASTTPLDDPKSGMDLEKKLALEAQKTLQRGLNLARAGHLELKSQFKLLPKFFQDKLEWVSNQESLCSALDVTPTATLVSAKRNNCQLNFVIPALTGTTDGTGRLWKYWNKSSSINNRDRYERSGDEENDFGYLRFKKNLSLSEVQKLFIEVKQGEVKCGQRRGKLLELISRMFGFTKNSQYLIYQSHRLLVHPLLNAGQEARSASCQGNSSSFRPLSTKKMLLTTRDWQCASSINERRLSQTLFLPHWSTRIEQQKGLL